MKPKHDPSLLFTFRIDSTRWMDSLETAYMTIYSPKGGQKRVLKCRVNKPDAKAEPDQQTYYDLIMRICKSMTNRTSHEVQFTMAEAIILDKYTK